MSVANKEHLRRLRRDVEAWNRWRKKNPDIRPDLSEAILSEADLSRANLSHVNLSHANLSRANFSRANFRGADLLGANFRGADLLGANFRGANFSRANLSRANFRGGNFRGANLREADLHEADLLGAELLGADLREANLLGAELFETVLSDIDLSTVKGLEACRHGGPSTIDYRTLSRSGQLPLSFLRGVGLPDTFIDYIPSIFTDQPIQFYSCFISYSHKDEAFAKRLHSDLQDKGVRCWYAPEDLPIGAKMRSHIDQAIRKHDKLLLVLSEHSVNSQWVENEVDTALEEERERNKLVLFPVRLDETVMNSRDGWAGQVKRSRHIGDFTHWKDYDSYQKGFERLVRDLKAALESTG